MDPRSTNAGITEVAADLLEDNIYADLLEDNIYADLLEDNIYVSGGFDESGSKYLEVPSSKY